MLAPTTLPRNMQSAIQLLEANPHKWWPMFLECLGSGDTDSTTLLLINILGDLHPTARQQCLRIAARRGVDLVV